VTAKTNAIRALACLPAAAVLASISFSLTACANNNRREGMTIAEYRALEPERRRDATAILENANEMLAEGRNQQAIERFAESIAVYDQIAAAWNNLGVAHLASGNFVEADQSFARAISLDPADYRPLFNRGLMYYERGFLREARGFFERAAKADDAQLAPLWYLIRVDTALGRETQQTLDAVERAMMLEQDPEYLRQLRLQRLRIEDLIAEDPGPRTGRTLRPGEIRDAAPNLPDRAIERLTAPAPATPEDQDG